MDRKHRVNLPPDPNPRPPRFTPPAGTCDTHFHVFGPPHVDITAMLAQNAF